jgi:VanZ family protein
MVTNDQRRNRRAGLALSWYLMQNTSVLKRVWLWAPPVVYMAIIFYLSAQSNPLPMLTEHIWDKALHLVEYGGLGCLLYRAIDGEGLHLTPAVLLALATTSVYGASDEWHQFFTPGRSADVHDWMADTLGGALGVAVYAVIVTVLSTPSRRQRRLRR